jgi:TolA-binding protein
MKRDYPEDLSIHARRGCLSRSERQTLERELGADPLLRVAHRVGSDFDRISAVRAGDDDLIARSIGRMARQSGPAPRARRVRRSLGILLAAAFVAGGVAAASGGAWYRAWVAEPAKSAQVAVETGTRSGPVEPAVRVEPAPPLGSAMPSAAAEAPPPSRTNAGTASSHAADPTAVGLFEQASAARRAGDYGRASDLFTELQQSFPQSAEAHLAEISLGKLLLASGRPERALGHFRRYLGSGGGPLGEEALVGSAESLMRLGRAADERRAWQELLEKYPTSVHAARASGRLGQIDDAAP